MASQLTQLGGALRFSVKAGLTANTPRADGRKVCQRAKWPVIPPGYSSCLFGIWSTKAKGKRGREESAWYSEVIVRSTGKQYEDKGGNKESVEAVAHLAFYSLAFSVYRGGHIDFLHVLQVGVKNKQEASVHTVRAICVEKQQTLNLCREVKLFQSGQLPIVHQQPPHYHLFLLLMPERIIITPHFIAG